MKWIPALVLASSVVALAPTSSSAQGSGSQPVGITTAEMKDVVSGWSAKKHVLGKPVYNDKNEKIGSIDDVIITLDKKLSYAVVGTGGFVGLGKHDVVVPIKQLQEQDGKFVLPGATKETLKALPAFEYAKSANK
jgi:hypothetical protein